MEAGAAGLGGLHSVDHGKLQKVINRGNGIIDLGRRWVNLTMVWRDKLEEDSLESEGQVEDYRHNPGEKP